MPKLVTSQDRKLIDHAKSRVCRGDLYRALHRVGDDLVKSAIEEYLEALLDEDAFKTVVAIFKVATSD